MLSKYPQPNSIWPRLAAKMRPRCHPITRKDPCEEVLETTTTAVGERSAFSIGQHIINKNVGLTVVLPAKMVIIGGLIPIYLWFNEQKKGVKGSKPLKYWVKDAIYGGINLHKSQCFLVGWTLSYQHILWPSVYHKNAGDSSKRTVQSKLWTLVRKPLLSSRLIKVEKCSSKALLDCGTACRLSKTCIIRLHEYVVYP